MITEDCVDCGGKPRFRGMVEIEDGRTTICTSSFHKIVEREAGGYDYLDSSLKSIHITSVPMTDKEALEYFSFVDTLYEDISPMYILKRPINEHKYTMMPYRYNAETREVNSIGTTSQES